MIRLKLLFTMLLLTVSAAVFAQKGITMELWPNGAPNAICLMKRKQRVVPLCAVLVADIHIWRWITKVISGLPSLIIRVLP